MKKLNQKYENQFYFFEAKGISSIIYSDNSNTKSRNYKDVLDFIDDTEYCKKYYRSKNKSGKN